MKVRADIRKMLHLLLPGWQLNSQRIALSRIPGRVRGAEAALFRLTTMPSVRIMMYEHVFRCVGGR